jgi:hypothetical protein
MLLWKMTEPSLPMGLKFAGRVMCADVDAWKLKTTSDPAYYNATDSDIALRIVNKLIKKAQEDGKWDMFHRQYVQLVRVLRRMSRRGVGVNKEKRLAARAHFEEMLETRIAELQPFYPFEAKKKRIYKASLPALLKKGWKEEDFVLVDVYEEVKKGWTIGSTGLLEKLPKAVKEKKPRSSSKRQSKKKISSVIDAENQLPLFSSESSQ